MANDKQPTRRQTPKTWAIRDDGMLFPALDSVLRNPRYRPYHGDINASLEERMAYLEGRTNASAAKVAAEQGVFNIATADKDALIDFMLDEYAYQLDGRRTIDKLRSEAIMHIQMKQAEAAGVEPTAAVEPAPKAKKAGIVAPVEG